MKIPIYIATELQHAGYEREIGAIDQASLNETVEKVKSALVNNRMLSVIQAPSTSFVTINYVTV
jgi:hypothetical protein